MVRIRTEASESTLSYLLSFGLDYCTVPMFITVNGTG